MNCPRTSVRRCCPTRRRSTPGTTSRRWRGTSSSAGSRMQSRRPPVRAGFGERRRSWRKASAGPAVGQGASTATAQASSGPPAKHRQLMPKHDDLQLVELARARTEQNEPEHAAERQITERPEQEQLLGFRGSGRTTLRSVRTDPSRNRVNAPVRMVKWRSLERCRGRRLSPAPPA